MDSDEFEHLASLFADDVFDDLLTKALLIGADTLHEDDLWVTTPSSMIRRSLLDAVCSHPDLGPKFFDILSEDLAPLVQRFVSLKLTFDTLDEEEQIALEELQSSYANDRWLWAKDAFSNTQEFVGSDLRGSSPEQISEAIIRLVAAAWSDSRSPTK